MGCNEHKVIGLGDISFTFAVYIANQPAMPEYQALNQLKPVQEGDVDLIGKACGNGWRKVFNVYAKLLYALDKNHFDFTSNASTWQRYRDTFLLQADSGNALLFSAPQLNQTLDDNVHHQLHIICGRTYAKYLIHERKLAVQLVWLDEDFAIDLRQRVIVCPYFDYRQLSNHKIQRLSAMISGLIVGEIRDL